jgi:WD40 repeat protein/serine/threonine protein kinase
LVRHADIVGPLAKCLDGLEFVYTAAPELSPLAAGPPSAAVDEAQPSGRLGDYQIVRELGRGGMGIVYEAEQISLRRRVALKVLPFAATLDTKQLQRFKTEAQAAAHLQHQNIVPVYAVGCDRGVHYYAMQFIDGQSLAALIRELRHQTRREPVNETGPQSAAGSMARELTSGRCVPARSAHAEPQPTGPYSSSVSSLEAPACEEATPQAALSTEHSTESSAFFQTVARLGVQAAEALEHTHQFGVLHRDIKPANLLVDARGNLWITDFGLAHCQSETGLTLTGDLVGTLRYMSPEQALAKRVLVDHRTDIYSLGVTLYELVTLEHAFEGTDRQELLHQIAFEEPRPPRRLNKSIPVELETIVLKAMQKNPAERYATAQEFADDLRRFLEDKPIRARRTTLAQHALRWCRRNKSLTVVGSVAAVALAGLAAGVAFEESIRSEKKQTEIAKQWAEEEREEVDRQRGRAEEFRAKAESLSARLALERGIMRCEQGDAPRGILWLAQSLKLAPENAIDLQRDIRSNLDRWQRDAHSLRLYFPHKGEVRDAVFSRDGKYLATASGDKTARVWEAATGKPVGDPLQHEGTVWTVAFSPTAETILTASADKTARLWHSLTGKLIARLTHQGEVRFAAFSPDGKTILTTSRDQTARLWDVGNCKELYRLKGFQGVISSGAFSPDGKTVVMGDIAGTARIWEVATGKLLGITLEHSHDVYAVAFSPDGTRIVTGSFDGTSRLWDAATGKALGPPLKLAARKVAFSPDGKCFVTADTDGTARVWDATQSKPIGKALQHVAAIYALSISPDSQIIATGSWDGTARLWEAATGQLVDAPFPHPGSVQALAFSPDGHEILTGCDDGARLWRFHSCTETRLKEGSTSALATGRGPDLLLLHRKPVSEVIVSSDGKTMVTVSGDSESGEVRLWDTDDIKVRSSLTQQAKVQSVAFSPDSKTLLTAGDGAPAVLWNVATGKEIRKLPYSGSVQSVAFSSDGKIAASCADRVVRFWDAATFKEIGTRVKNRWRKARLAFSPNGKVLFLVEDSAGMLYDTETGELIGGPLMNEGSWVYDGAFSPDGKTLITGGGNGTVRMWDVATLKPFRHAYEDINKNKPIATLVHTSQAPVSSVAFSPNGKMIVTGCHDGTTRLWDAAARKPIGTPFRHQDRVETVSFALAGKLVVTGTRDGIVRVREVPAPVPGSADRLLIWCQVLTNMRLNEEGQSEALDGPTWQQRRQLLEELGGPPRP